ncbi:MAG: DUF2569 family protein [Desulfobaccales bacterium]
MCIFCGGQCGGVGEFLISLGLPFLALYFSRMKKALLRIKNRIIPRGSHTEKTHDKAIKYRCCGEWRSTGLKEIGLIGSKSPLNKRAYIPNAITQFNNLRELEQKSSPKGVKGWLLLLCLNLTIFIPASCLYEANCTLDLFNSTRNKILLFMFKELLLYNMLLIGIMVFLTIFSFYAGLRLWEVKPRAVKIAKTFLILQLSLTSILVIIGPFMTLPLGGNENILRDIIKRLTPSLLNFSLWYLYLSNSSRVFTTYGEAEKKSTNIRQLPIKLKSSTELT